jgi:hypothetical protein
MPVEAELKRRNTSGALVGWVVNPDGTEPVADADARAKLQTVIEKLSAALTVGGTVALDAATLNALENITATIANHPADYPLPAAQVAALKEVVAAVSGTVSVANMIPATETGLAKEATLQSILDVLANVEDAVHAEVANIAANTWTTVVSRTPTVATTVLGFNADVSALTDVLYRQRLVVGGVVKCSETIGAAANAWIPIQTDVAAGQAIEVQVFHGEVTAQTFRATISYGS